MAVTQEIVRSALASAAGSTIDLPADVPLSSLRINSLAMLTVFIRLEEASRITLSRQDAVQLSGSSIDQIVE